MVKNEWYSNDSGLRSPISQKFCLKGQKSAKYRYGSIVFCSRQVFAIHASTAASPVELSVYYLSRGER